MRNLAQALSVIYLQNISIVYIDLIQKVSHMTVGMSAGVQCPWPLTFDCYNRVQCSRGEFHTHTLYSGHWEMHWLILDISLYNALLSYWMGSNPGSIRPERKWEPCPHQYIWLSISRCRLHISEDRVINSVLYKYWVFCMLSWYFNKKNIYPHPDSISTHTHGAWMEPLWKWNVGYMALWYVKHW